MHLYIHKIKRIARAKKIPLDKLAKLANMSENGFHTALRNNTLKVRNLLSICEALEINPGDLLKDETSIIPQDIPKSGRDTNEILKEVLNSVKRIESKLNH